jgi:hypothetical protein
MIGCRCCAVFANFDLIAFTAGTESVIRDLQIDEE